MHVVYSHCCGLDVHKRSSTACLLASGASGKGQHEIRRFGTMTRDLWELADWRQSQYVTHMAMESTPRSPTGCRRFSRTPLSSERRLPVSGAASRVVPFLLSSWLAQRRPATSLRSRGDACAPSVLPGRGR
jgi:hypothetical protein